MMSDNITLVKSTELFATINKAKSELGFTLLLDITAVDNLHKSHPPFTRFELIYILRHSNFKDILIYKVAVEDADVGVESISSLFSSADWAEREIFDQYGIHFKNHKMLKRVLNHNEFVGHPLRKDYEITKGQYCTVSQDMMDEMKPLLNARALDMKKDDLMIVNLGPSHPASHGTIRKVTCIVALKRVVRTTTITRSSPIPTDLTTVLHL
jgi:NADH-quinone oxidoreductase subunit C/D